MGNTYHSSNSRRKELSKYGFKRACSSVLFVFHWHPHTHWPTYTENPKWGLNQEKKRKPKILWVRDDFLAQILYYLNMFCFTCCFSLGLFDLGGGFVLCFLLSYSFVSTFPKYQTKSQIINFVLLFFSQTTERSCKIKFFLAS